LHNRKQLFCSPTQHFRTPDPTAVYRYGTAAAVDILPQTKITYKTENQHICPSTPKPHR